MAPKILFNNRHLQKGDPKPEYNGKLRVYNMRYCPFAQRSFLILLYKKLDFEVVNVKILNAKPEWLNEMNPFGAVPVIEAKEGQYVYESLVTVDYLEDLYPERSSFAKDPYRRAIDRIIVDAFRPTKYIEDMLKQPIIKECSVPEHALKAFYIGYVSYQPEYSDLPEDK